MDDSTWLRDIIRIALTNEGFTGSLEVKSDGSAPRATSQDNPIVPNDPGKDARFRKIVEAVLDSRRLVYTYNVVLIFALAVFIIWHWSEQVMLRRKARQQKITSLAIDDLESSAKQKIWSSSSSTIEGNATPRRTGPKLVEDANESSPLLSHESLRANQSTFTRPYYVLKSILQYQPPTIPVINRTLPPNATSLFSLAWILLIFYCNIYNIPYSFPYIFVFADRCGLIFAANLPLLYLLAAKNQPLQMLTGYSYESLNIFHRRVGEMLSLQALIHFLSMMMVWYGMLRPLGFTLARFLFNSLVLLGLAAFGAYELLYLTSLGSFRQRCYELFLASHIFLQIAGLAFLWFHYHTSKPYVGLALAIFLLDRLVYRMWIKSSTHPAILTILEDGETILLSANWDMDAKRRACLPSNMKKGWKTNQHAFVSMPELSKEYALQSHPFTIFSAAPEKSQNTRDKHAWFALLIRAQAPHGFTHALLQHARNTSNIQIRLDGPYGSSHALDILSSSAQAIVIAGGSGIAVAYPLLYALLCPPQDALQSTPARWNNKLRLLWITHTPSHCLWIPQAKLQELVDWGLETIIPPPTEIAGRPDVKRALNEWVEGVRGQTGIVVSGPDGLVRDVRNSVAGLTWRGADVTVQVEKFGW